MTYTVTELRKKLEELEKEGFGDTNVDILHCFVFTDLEGDDSLAAIQKVTYNKDTETVVLE